ncbi:MAG: 2-oxo acid dehydrogenase subunit E2 [Candidatus Wallbacteria bacterium]|nr:2-oxo acid dehydrogenase subunit E2 [Candidatus Wallbacteria bacterium]
MLTDLVMPQMGESVAEGTVTKWYVKAGDAVQKDQTVLSISTDKVDAEIPAPAAGVLTEVLVGEGTKVNIGTVLARIDSDASAGAARVAAPAPAAAVAAPVETPAQAAAAIVAASPAPPPPVAAPRAAPAAAPAGDDRRGFYSPLVLSIARTEGVSMDELASIRGSGTGGRVQKKDILAYVESRKAGGTAPAPAAGSAASATATPAAPQPLAPAPAPTVHGSDVEVVAMDTMRRAISEHMVRSVHTSPHVTSLHEVDMTRIARFREKAKAQFQAREGFNLTFTPFFVAAAARALRSFPAVNASIDGTNVLLKRRINIGVAVALEGQGLIVPVVKSADTMNLVGLARALNDLVARARTRKLAPDDVAGGTFTITNLGSAGSLTGTPIINQPQVAIMGVGAIKKRPVVIDDAIAIREMMFLSMSYDHRWVDGMLAGRFLSAVTEQLEQMELEGHF